MRDQKGFTLLELLIAAAIIGVLAIFATQSFRQTASQTRVEDAKVRAKAVAMAARRFLIDYPKATVTVNTSFGRVNEVNKDSVCSHQVVTLQNLVNCEYLDYRQYAAEEYASDTSKYQTHFDMYFGSTGGTVCFKAAAQSKVLDTKTYCTNGEIVW